jgi:Na+-driven multidrug efflux pump
VLVGVVRSTGAVIVPVLLLFVSLWLVRFPLAYALLDRWQEDAIWWSFPAGAICSVVLVALYYRFGGWRKARMGPTAAPSR